MRRHYSVPALVAVVLVTIIVPALGQAPSGPVAGEWKGQWGPQTITLMLTVKGNVLTGQLSRAIEVRADLRNKPHAKLTTVTVDIEDGKVNGTAIEFKADIAGPEGQANIVSFKGSAQQGKLTLATQKPAKEESFTLTRWTSQSPGGKP